MENVWEISLAHADGDLSRAERARAVCAGKPLGHDDEAEKERRVTGLFACRFSFSSSPTFKRGKLSQALIDICAVLVALLLILVTSLGTIASLFILFFVST
ncbi:hypothetical protein [Bradyrhizobium sp. SZCCHNR2026]|uniref:hypothetical protein n=1 Tax=Bradyrhizobium sp. SZCCHNR2026 TaxID=3057381 RepID=UPI002916D05B|nr:hypothetical protein [Bradyrhizobium sp. SZCCHNR2026]